MSKARIGMVTVGQAPRGDVVPDMAALLPGVEILEAGALDGLDRAAIARLAPAGDDEILVTRLADASSVFVGKSHVLPRVKARIAALEDQGVALTVLLCTHDMDEAAALCDRVLMMDGGRVLADGTPDELCRQFEGDTLEDVFMHLTGKTLEAEEEEKEAVAT